MGKIKLLLLVWLAVLSAEGQEVITGKLINQPQSQGVYNTAYVYFLEPINGYSNMFFNEKRVPVKKDNSFTITTELKKEGFIYVKLPGKSLWLFVQPNDTVSFEATFIADKQHKYLFSNIEFTGKNASGHKAFIANPSYGNMQGFLLKNLFNQKSATPEQFAGKMLHALQQILYPLDSLHQGKKIDAAFYKALSADIKGSFGSEVIDLYEVLLNFKGKKPSGNKIHQVVYNALAINQNVFTKENLETIKGVLYNHINPLDENISYSFLGKSYTSQYCRDMQSGLVQPTLPYDSVFAGLKDIEHYGYLKGKFLENLWQSHLYWSASTEPDGKVLERGLKLFASYFPSSGFLPYLKERLGTAIQDRALKDEISGGIEFVINKQYGSLQQLAKENFKGSYVLVDLWATWCSPCIYDFTFKNGLKAFLQEKEIQALYVSIDKESDRNKWKSLISRNELNGFHFLASDSLVQDIQARLYKGEEVMIPRYVLIDKSGEIIAPDLPRPSDMEALKKEINRLLEKEQKQY